MDVLRDYALSNVWCSPEMDKQAIILPARLSPKYGALHSIRVTMQEIVLPTVNKRYHVYQIGQMPTPLFDVSISVDYCWETLETLANRDEILFSIYTTDGVEIPKCKVFAMLTQAENMIIAVEQGENIPSLRDQHVYAGFYSNAFRTSIRSRDIDDFVHTKGVVINTPRDALPIVDLVNEYTGDDGSIRIIHNGYLRPMPNIHGLQKNDTLEFLYDATIHAHHDFHVKDLPVFNSELDGIRKYLVHTPKDVLSVKSIFFLDDLEIYVLRKDVDGYSGVKLHRNSSVAIRMLSHQDYSFPTDYIHKFCMHLGILPEEAIIRIYYRDSGWERPIIHDNNFIPSLYKLSDENITKAMSSSHETVTNWRAESLESSMYPKVMRVPGVDVTREMAMDAFGYGTSSYLLQNPVASPVAGDVTVVPKGYSTSGVSYYFDRINNVVNETVLESKMALANDALVNGTFLYLNRREEAFNKPLIDEEVTVLDSHTLFNCYKAEKVNGEKVSKWIPAIEGEDYVYNSGAISWELNPNLYSTMVVPSDFLAKEERVYSSYEDLVNVPQPINVNRKHGDEYIPVGEELYLVNGKPLINGIDVMRVDDTFIVTNKHVLTEGEIKLTILSIGCENSKSVTEFGIVKHGLLSVNHRHQIHMGLPIYVVANGSIYNPKQLRFIEDTVDGNNVLPEGTPYLLVRYNSHILGINRAQSIGLKEELSAKIEDIEYFMTEHLPEPTPEGVVIIEHMHNLFSPFMDKLVRDMSSGELTLPTGRVLDKEIHRLLEPYLYLLSYDPVESPYYDPTFMSVHPVAGNVTITVEPHEYSLLTRIVDRYLDNEVSLNNFVGVRT